MKAAYYVKDPIEIIFNQIELGKELIITGDYPFSNDHVTEMGITHILDT